MNITANIRMNPWRFLFTLLLFAIAFCGVDRGLAQSDEIAFAFPEPNQVASDYPVETQRYVVLNFLWDYLHEKAPDSPSAKSKRSAYYNSSTAIRT